MAPSEETQDAKGVLDLAARVAGHLLSNPANAAAVKVLLENVDPASAPDLARLLLRKNPDLTQSALAALPAIANAAIRFFDTLLLELKDNLPGGILAAFVEDTAAELDAKAFRRMAWNGVWLLNEVFPILHARMNEDPEEGNDGGE
jgi:hypothetical protein